MRSTLDGLAGWLSRQSWYAGSPDGIPRLRELAELFLPCREPDARVRVLLVRDEAPETPVLYQLPIVERDRLGPHDSSAIATGYGGVALVDGPTDPAFAAALLGALRDRGELRDPADDRYVVASSVVEDGPAAVMRIELYGGPVIEARIARRVLDGTDPDAVAAVALADADGTGAPRLVGVLPVEWTERDAPHLAHLAVLRESESGTRDGWTHLVAAARRGADVADDTRALGAALARTHGALRPLGSRPASPSETAGMLGAWRTRLAGAVREVAGLAARHAALSSAQDSAGALAPWPELQTIHGALDLGAARRRPDGSWYLVGHGAGDARPAAERMDLPVRDVAGALRSIQYAGALAGVPGGWIEEARRGLLDGYASVAGDAALPAALLDAIELDYAVLDAVWESRVRPAGLRVPLAAVDRILSAGLDEPAGTAAA